jgi:hypothetical protein
MPKTLAAVEEKALRYVVPVDPPESFEYFYWYDEKGVYTRQVCSRKEHDTFVADPLARPKGVPPYPAQVVAVGGAMKFNTPDGWLDEGDVPFVNGKQHITLNLPDGQECIAVDGAKLVSGDTIDLGPALKIENGKLVKG